ncbi:MAG: biotin/lipoyl-binding protein [Planctomycetales bacterium]|nr:biotin/lipoyl-binding protein [Planctomycetales bacterium]
MPTLSDSIVSSSSRKLAIRVRPDLKARRQRYQGRVYWVVKDPVGLQYFRFEEEEFAILQMLDGDSSLDEIAERFEADFPPQTIRVEELQNFIGMLHRSGLVLSDSPGQGTQLKERRDERKRKELIGAASNILAFRFRGFDPERILNWLLPVGRFFFSGPMTAFNLLLVSCALTLVMVEFDLFRSRLPSFHTFFNAQNWLALGATLAVTKVLHEFGHGLSCKHFGGECHEMGVMFLVLTPCLYCNVSDSWMLPSRWKRAAIGAAGMYVEVVLASIATFVWWFSEPGWLNYICLNVMFVSSVSTIMFNANPLLRYDGYYILSDLMEVPNLRQKATDILNRKLRKWCLGLEEPDDPFLPKRHQALFALFTVASFLYRWVVLLSILYFLNKVFEPYGLKVIGQTIAMASIWGLFAAPLWKGYQFFKVPGRLTKMKRLRMYVTLLVVAAAFAAVLLVPLPSHVYCPFEVQPRGATSVYVDSPGRLVEVNVEAGDPVEVGQLIARLENEPLQMEILKLESQLAAYETELKSLQRLRLHDASAAMEVDVVEEKIAAAKDQLAQQRDEYARLTIKAPVSGVVIPPPPAPEHKTDPEVELPEWFGSPLDPENRGALLNPEGPRNMLCQIIDPQAWDAVMVIDQDDVDLVQEGQRVQLLLEEAAWHEFDSKIDHRATDAMDSTPMRLASTSGGPVPAQAEPDGVIRPLNTSYQATAPLDAAGGLLRSGLTGIARITTPKRTLGQRLYRYLSRTFNFEI